MYRAGDIYGRGDFLGIGKALKSVVQASGKIGIATALGGPAGFAIAAGRAIMRSPASSAARSAAGAVAGTAGTAAADLLGSNIPSATAPVGGSRHGTPHGSPGSMLARSPGNLPALPGGGAPRGYHAVTRVSPLGTVGTKFVRNRRMNWANPRALARAERRIHSAVKHMTRYIRWVHPKKEGHAAPKFGSHRRKK